MSNTIPTPSTYCIFCGMQVAEKANYCSFCGAARKAVEHEPEAVSEPGPMTACPNCNEEIDRVDAKFCHGCGLDLATKDGTAAREASPVAGPRPASPAYTVLPVASPSPVTPATGAPASPKKADRITAGVLAILLGSIGVHKFYMGKIGHGILCILFCWTGIPALVGLIEGILYLTASDKEFQEKYI